MKEPRAGRHAEKMVPGAIHGRLDTAYPLPAVLGGSPLAEFEEPPTGGGGAPTVVVAAANASDLSKSKADLICDGAADATTFASAAALLPSMGGRILLTEGNFNLASASVNLRAVSGAVTFEGMGPSTVVSTGSILFHDYVAPGGRTGLALRNLIFDRVYVEVIYVDFLICQGVTWDGPGGVASHLYYENARTAIVSDCVLRGRARIWHNAFADPGVFDHTSSFVFADSVIDATTNYIAAVEVDDYDRAGAVAISNISVRDAANSTAAIFINTCGSAAINGVSSVGCTGAAVYCQNVDTLDASGFASNDDHHAVVADYCGNPTIGPGIVKNARAQGVVVNGEGQATPFSGSVRGVTVDGASTSSPGTHPCIQLKGSIADAAAMNNVCRSGGTAKAGIEVTTYTTNAGTVYTPSGTLVVHNDLRGGGWGTGALVDAGAGTVTSLTGNLS